MDDEKKTEKILEPYSPIFVGDVVKIKRELIHLIDMGETAPADRLKAIELLIGMRHFSCAGDTVEERKQLSEMWLTRI